MYRIGTVVGLVVAALWLNGCAKGSGDGTAAPSARGASFKASLSQDFSGNFLGVSGTRAVAVDAKYPCLSQVTACLALDSSGKTGPLNDLCPSVDTPQGDWSFTYGLYTDEDCTQPLGNVACVVPAAEALSPGENHNVVECLTSNAQKVFDVCLYDPVTKAGYGKCSPVNCVYTNDDVTTNTVSAFKANADGSLTAVSGSPFLTGGTGGSSIVLYAANRITTQAGNYLYASNAVSGDITAFGIDPTNCSLSPIGKPFPAAVFGYGISLAATPDGAYLYAGTGAQLYGFAVRSDGSLSALTPASYPLPTGYGTDGMMVSPDGKFLAIAGYSTSPANGVVMFGIQGDGSLAAVTGSPFAVDPGGDGATGIDINCASNLMFVSEPASPGLVDVFALAGDGTLAPSGGTPYSFVGTQNSNVALLSPDDALLFVSHQGSAMISVARVGPGGSLSAVAGSPFATGTGAPSGMATTAAGDFLYVAAFGRIDGFSVAGDGTLAAVPGTPVVLATSKALSIEVYPAKTCH